MSFYKSTAAQRLAHKIAQIPGSVVKQGSYMYTARSSTLMGHFGTQFRPGRSIRIICPFAVQFGSWKDIFTGYGLSELESILISICHLSLMVSRTMRRTIFTNGQSYAIAFTIPPWNPWWNYYKAIVVSCILSIILCNVLVHGIRYMWYQ